LDVLFFCKSLNIDKKTHLSEFVGDTLSFIAPDKKEEAKDEKKLKAPHAWHLVVVNRGGAANIYACMHINSKYKFKKVNNVRENLPPTTTNQNKKNSKGPKISGTPCSGDVPHLHMPCR
jgi:hypothetical protein